MAEMTQEEMVQEVLDRVLQSSTGVEDLETVTSLNGVKSLPGEKDGKMVIVPLELIGKPASDAAARAEAAAKKAEYFGTYGSQPDCRNGKTERRTGDVSVGGIRGRPNKNLVIQHLWEIPA